MLQIISGSLNGWHTKNHSIRLTSHVLVLRKLSSNTFKGPYPTASTHSLAKLLNSADTFPQQVSKELD